MAAVVVVQGLGRVAVAVGATLLEACEAGGIDMPTECGGFAACNSCRVRVLEGGASLSPTDVSEEPFLDRPDQRLGCQARVAGDVVVALDPGID